MAAFSVGDLNFLATIVSDDLFTPSTPWKQRGGMPANVEAGGQSYPLKDVPVTQYSPEWWWVYFWDQAKGRVTGAKAPQKTAILAFFNKAFVKSDTMRTDAEEQRYVIPKGPLETVFAGDYATLRGDPSGTAKPATTVGYWKQVVFGDGRVIGR